jgi:hypothetical protein
MNAMNTCNYCGVELEVDMNFCPLCGHKSNAPLKLKRKESSKEKSSENSSEEIEFLELTQPQRHKIALELIAVMLISGVLVSFAIDLFINRQITWSKFTITAGLFLLTTISLFFMLLKKRFLLVAGCFISTSLLLLLLDFFNHHSTWGLKLGIPIVFSISFVVYFLSLIIYKSRQKGINLIAYTMLAAGILCFFIEGAISFFAYDHLRFQWSLIVLISVIPVAAILAYIHFRLKRATSLRKFFHL